MKLSRRQSLHLAAYAAALSSTSHIARAQTYPTRPVRIIVGFAAGGTQDIVARLIGQSLSERLGGQFIIDNRPGASGNTAIEAVTRAAPDGYTLVIMGTTSTINATLYDKLNFVFARDLAPVASLVRVPLVMEVHPSLPANSVPEFIAYAKSNPGNISFASSGAGTPLHVAGELFKVVTGINMVHVPYRGSAPALTDLIGGQVQLMFADLPASIDYVKTDRLRALAVTSAMRTKVLPAIPAVSDFVPGFEASVWLGVGAPRNTPAPIIERLNREINAALADLRMKARLTTLGLAPFISSPAALENLIAAETEKWAKVIRAANIKAQ